MFGPHRFRNGLLRLALITTIAVVGAGALSISVSAADTHRYLVKALEQANVVVEAAAIRMLRLSMEFRLDLASF